MKGMGKLSFADLQFDKKWEYHSADGKVLYISGIIAGHLLYSKLSGNASESMVDEIVPFLEAAYRYGGFKGAEFIRFADYSYLNNASLNARRAYTHAITQLNEKYHCHPWVTYIIGASFKMRIAFKFFNKFIKQNYIFADNGKRGQARCTCKISNFQLIINPSTQFQTKRVNNVQNRPVCQQI